MGKPRHGATILQQQSGLHGLLEHARLVGQLQHVLHACLPAAAAAHCHLADYSQGRLLIIIDNAHWATRMRYQQDQLAQRLRRHNEFADLRQIQFRVRPGAQFASTEQNASKARKQISAKARESIRDCADAISDQALREALLRLIRD